MQGSFERGSRRVEPWFRVFGFISIPYMALSAFSFVLVMMAALRVNTTEPSE